LFTTYVFIGFQENIQQFIPQVEISFKGESLISPSTTIPNDNLQCNVKHKLDFDESKLSFGQNPLKH
jgi:hypothetical protein